MPFTAATEGQNRLDLRELCESFANNLWIPDHLLPHEREAFALDLFTRTVAGELKLLTANCQDKE